MSFGMETWSKSEEDCVAVRLHVLVRYIEKDGRAIVFLKKLFIDNILTGH